MVTPFRPTLDRLVNTMCPERRLLWVMLNPSTADVEQDDPTIRRVKRFTLDAGHGHLRVVNLFDARATNPADLYRMDVIESQGNAELIEREMANATNVVFAWGGHGERMPGTANATRTIVAAERLGIEPWCLGWTKTGQPLHPLYLPADRSFAKFADRCSLVGELPW